jgi:anaerobic magnesium-protoporphyrin IX monomethyl ester cyclase
VKFLEAVLQVRPRALRRVFAHPERPLRDAMKWYSRIGRQVWSYEIRNFLFRDRCRKDGPTLAEFWGRPPDKEDRDFQRGAEFVEQVREES